MEETPLSLYVGLMAIIISVSLTFCSTIHLYQYMLLENGAK